ncbi:glutaredoxin family protein [Domibacillus iocasae]|jgi:hypothetical protein|uniref:NrdH-redoxin n=1 Tax=Domibacillus iocasae TaxID=1714016 RepID=A0A1E7DSW0_9BACI|nr:glutaredoxin family protein [Domibacillus iocasae]OES46162.1 NrdH-redoxin [Domibacillus iocasae]
MKIDFYTRPGCHLCEEAKIIVQLIAEELGLKVHERNIEEKDEWTEEYGLIIPVLKAGKDIIAYGKIDYVSALTKLRQKINK